MKLPLTRLPLITTALVLGSALAPSLAQDSGKPEGGCTPVPEYDPSSPTNNSSPDEDENVSGSGGKFKPMNDWNWGVDSGKYIKSKASGRCTAEAEGYLWAEDGDSTSVTWDADSKYTHTFTTTCQPKPGHKVPPLGDSEHFMKSNAKIDYNVTSSGTPKQRGGSCTMLAKLPTGRQVKVDYTLTDSGTKNDKTVQFIGQAGYDSSGTVTVSGSADGDVKVGASRARKLGLKGTVTVTHRSVWTSLASVNDSDKLDVDDEAWVFPGCNSFQCASLKLNEEERATLNGSLTLQGETDDAISTVKGKFKVVTHTTVQSFPGYPCGDVGLPDYGGRPTTGGSSTGSTTGGSNNPTTPRGTTTTTPGGTSTGTGHETKGTTSTQSGAQTPLAVYSLEVRDEPVACQFRLGEETQHLASFLGTATAVEVSAVGSSGASIQFDPNGLVDLDPGLWRIEIPLVANEAGLLGVEMSFDPGFDDFAVAAVELIESPFSMSPWSFGMHTASVDGVDPYQTFGYDVRIAVDAMLDDPLTLGEPVVSVTVPDGSDVVWMLEPTVSFDEDLGSWILELAPQDAALVDVEIGFGADALTIPVELTEGAPDFESGGEDEGDVGGEG